MSDTIVQMLRRHPQNKFLAPIFPEARWRGHGRHEHDARVPAARRSRHAHAQPKAIGCALPARRRRWLEHRRAFRRAQLLPPAPHHRHSATEARRRQHGRRPRRIFRPASQPLAPRTALPQKSTGHRSRCRLARSHALALRCSGLHGIRHAWRQSHRRRLARSRAANHARRPRLSFPRRGPGTEPSAHAAGQHRRHRSPRPKAIQNHAAIRRHE